MNNQTILAGVVGLVVGALLTWAITNYQMPKTETQMTQQPHESVMQSGQSMSMDQMVEEIKGKTGDDFDKAFILGMIEHHEGAIEMAQEAKVNAKHEEIKAMADEIISAQSREITQMKQWQKDWGYE